MECGDNKELCEVGGKRTQDHLTNVLRNGVFWVFFILTLIAVIIMVVMMGCGVNNLKMYQVPSWVPSSELFIILWVFAYILLAYIGYKAVGIGNRTHQIITYVLFALILITQLIWTYLFFTKSNFSSALIALAFTLIFAVILFIQMWYLNYFLGFLMLIYLIWLFVCLAITFQLYNSSNECDKVTTEEECESHHDLPSPDSSDCEENEETVVETVGTST